MSSVTQAAATLDDLMRVDGKAELIAGRIVHLMPTGHRPSRVAASIFRSLDNHAAANGVGVAYSGNIGFAVSELSSGRQSFSPDASYYVGPLPTNEMDFVPGPPTLAVEVRSKDDYGHAAERAMAAKRADYFEAGTAVVWDVDPLANLIRSYREDSPDQPTVFGPGQIADAEPAVPGWTVRQRPDLRLNERPPMSSPFPGMNPYLEQDDAWHDFHEKIIPLIAERLVVQVRPEYIVKIDEHIYVHELPIEPRRLLGRSDVAVSRSDEIFFGTTCGHRRAGGAGRSEITRT